jgi:hypothetical protein
MMASETMSTMAADPVLNIFKTFSQVNNHSLKSLFAVASKTNFNEEIMTAASSLSTNFLIFPIEQSPSTYPKGWAQKLSVEMFERNICTIAFFIDRGFGIASASNDNFANLRDQEYVQIEVALSQFSAKKHGGDNSSSQTSLDVTESAKKQTLFFAFGGTPDDLEVCVLLNYLAYYPSVTIKLMVLVELEAGSDADIALESLKSFPTVSVETNLTGDIVKGASELGAKDLILVAHSKYTSDNKFQNWLDDDCLSSYCIVKSAVKGEQKRIIVQA